MTPDDHKIVQLARDTALSNNLYVGVAGEITVDEDNWNVRLHDGVTPGGRIIANLDNLDTRFQARSTELDGLLGFKDQDRGLLARLGPGTYRLRTIAVNLASLKISFANGYGGNPSIDLADSITKDVSFAGDVDFSQPIQADGGVVGDVTGNVVGDVTGDLLGNVTGNLAGNSAGTHIGPQVGNVDVRGHTLLLDDGQIHLAALNQDVLDYIFARACPVGIIAPFGGIIADIPANWSLCDGSNGTPDLRNLFVIGAGDTYAVGDSGGSDTTELAFNTEAGGVHTHGFTDDGHVLTALELPSHRHLVAQTGSSSSGTLSSPALALATGKVSAGNSNYDLQGLAGDADAGATSPVGHGDTHTHSGTTDASATHVHAVNQTIDNLPPYFALAYIMKVS